MPAERTTYDLFISYVRRDARLKVGRRTVDLVALLKQELESHERPKDLEGPSRFIACTDVDDFELGGTFDQVMSDRIERSMRFLLVCSPNVSSSEYVLREIELFRQLKAGQRPVAAILGTKPFALLPDLFSDRDVAADLTQHDEATMRDVGSALRRESHKIVAQVWGISTRDVFDRFEARRRNLRRRIAAATILALLVFAALVLGLGGEVGYHRVTELIPPSRLVSPAGVGFAADGSTPVVIRDRAAYLWRRLETGPEKLDLSIYALRAVQDRPGRMAIVDVNEFAVVDLSTGGASSSRGIPGETAGIASWKGTAAISNKNGQAFIIDPNGAVSESPRPSSQAGRRFPAFRQTGPFGYGEQLALTDRYLASATLTGRLGILDRTTDRFVVAAAPQFPLAEPIEHTENPILYETENTRPISTLTFLPDGDLMFAEGAGLRRVDPRTGKITFLSHCPIELVRQLIPLPNTRTLIALTSSTLEELRFDSLNRNTLRCVKRTTLAPKSSPRAALADDGRTILIAYFDAAPDLWRPTFSLFGWQIPIPAWL